MLDIAFLSMMLLRYYRQNADLSQPGPPNRVWASLEAEAVGNGLDDCVVGPLPISSHSAEPVLEAVDHQHRMIPISAKRNMPNCQPTKFSMVFFSLRHLRRGPTTRSRIVRLPRLLGILRQFPVQPAGVPTLATKDRSRPLSHQLTLVGNKGRRHPKLMQLAKISRSLHLNLIKSGLVVSLRGVKVCYCLQMAQVDVRHF